MAGAARGARVRSCEAHPHSEPRDFFRLVASAPGASAMEAQIPGSLESFLIAQMIHRTGLGIQAGFRAIARYSGVVRLAQNQGWPARRIPAGAVGFCWAKADGSAAGGGSTPVPAAGALAVDIAA